MDFPLRPRTERPRWIQGRSGRNPSVELRQSPGAASERRFHIGGIEWRQEGRTLTGTAVRYGDEAVLPWGRERFESQAFDLAGADVILNRMHLREAPLARTGAGLTLVDSERELRFEAKLPETRDADDTVALVRAGVLRGASVEFRAIKESAVGSTRVIERAELLGIAIVDRPAYSDSVVTAMRSRLTALSASLSRPRRYWL